MAAAFGLPQPILGEGPGNGPSVLDVIVTGVDPSTCSYDYDRVAGDHTWSCARHNPEVTHYKHKLILLPQLVYDVGLSYDPFSSVMREACTGSDYGDERTVSVPITDDISAFPDGNLLLCILGNQSVGSVR